MQMGNQPKQYLVVQGRPILDYCLCTFQNHEMIDKIMIVADKEWHGFIHDLLQKSGINKFVGYASPGETRQLSILNGLEAIQEFCPDTTNVVVHDAARPLVTADIISECISGLYHYDGVMPVLQMKDTCYQSSDGKTITGFIPRSELVLGQAPEAFRFPLYLECHYRITMDELRKISGSSELAFKAGLNILMVQGSEQNIKITTKDDLSLFCQYLCM